MKRPPKHTRSKKKRLHCRAESQQTGIVHYADVDGIMMLVDLYVANYSTRLKVDLTKNAVLWRRLQQGIAPTPSYLEWEAPVFRIVYGGYDSLSITGSLKDGGRLNIGGPQFVNQSLFPNLSTQACLYAATTLACAQIEAGFPLGKAEEYQLNPLKKFQLWKLSEVIGQLDVPGLLNEVNATPMNAIWAAQKSPLASQLLGAYLRSIGGDGIIFPSTKMPDQNIIAFFLRDDNESHTAFQSNRIARDLEEKKT